jgi:hypothetical protein
MLVELLLALVPAALVLGVLILVTNDAIRLNRRADWHAQRMTAMDTLHDRLSADALAAAACRWTAGAAAELMLRGSDGASVRYAFAPDRVTRFVDGAPASVWSARRLAFRAQVVQGGRGALLMVAFIEQRPEHSDLLFDRTFVASVVLPQEEGPR